MGVERRGLGGLEFQFVADVEDVAGGIVFIVAIRPLIDVADVQRTLLRELQLGTHRQAQFLETAAADVGLAKEIGLQEAVGLVFQL